MGAYSGTAGSVVYLTGGTTLVNEIAEWSLDIAMSPVETTAFGDQWADFVPSIRNATGSFSGNWEGTAAAQSSLETAMLGGVAVALRLYVAGTTYYNVPTAYLTGQGNSVSQTGKADVSWDFQAAAAVTRVG
jgi:hypothetical protein